jgi:basic amino acid/polyamine antiporter, APA family
MLAKIADLKVGATLLFIDLFAPTGGHNPPQQANAQILMARSGAIIQNAEVQTAMRNGPQTELVKGLGVFGATSVVAGTMIGTAIFVVPGIMLQQVGTPSMVLVVWVAAGVLSLFGALAYAELGAAMPQAGGEFVYMYRAYGPLFGFLYGWTQFIIAKAASIAAIATGFVLYLAYFFPRLHETLWGTSLHIGGHAVELRLTGLQLGATLMVLLLSGLNILGVRRSGAVQTLFTASKLLVLAILIVMGLTYGHGSWQGFRPFFAAGGHGGLLTAFGVATVSALWAYDGWNNLSMVAGEVKNPQRNIPVALIVGALLVLIVYVLVNLAYFYVLPASLVLGTKTVASDAARRILGSAGGAFIAVGVMISTFATLNGSILAGSRIPYATAREGLFPAALAAVHPRFHTPAVSLVGQAIIAGLFALTGQYQSLYTKVIFSEFLFYALCTAGVFVLRRREPDLPRPYRTWGYPLVPAVFVILAVFLLVNTFWQQRADSMWGVVLVGSGIPAYWIWKAWVRHYRCPN